MRHTKTEIKVEGKEQGMTREEKGKAIDALKISAPVKAVTQEEFNDYIQILNKVMDWLEQEPCENMGEVSDGYHTFNQLYHQRAVLFATIVNEHPDISWKSFRHSDGHYCFDEDGEMFIVGIDTPEGLYTYHYHKKYWDLFRCKELEHGKEWDGHTEKDVTRLLSLKQEPCEDAVSRTDLLDAIYDLDAAFDDNFELDYGRCYKTDCEKMAMALPSVTPKQRTGKWIPRNSFLLQYKCSECGLESEEYNFCPNCGAKMEVESE